MPALIHRFTALLAHHWDAERERLILWSPFAVMAGIGWYFTLADEPPGWTGTSLLACCAIAFALGRKHKARRVLAVLLLIALGFAAAQWRTQSVATPLLAQTLFNRQVEATVDEIDLVEQKMKLTLSQASIEGLDAGDTPTRLHVTFRHPIDGLQSGDRLRFAATLYPLPAPTMPGSYDFARHFYFKRIGGTGFALRPPEIITSNTQSGIAIWLNNLRHAIGEDMRAHMQGPVGTVAAAMTVGETGPIPLREKTALRDSGLAHMLAIAGLHLGIVAGIVFFSARLLLTLWPRMALRLPVKKIAAMIALISALIYLLLAGHPIPAQRAFIMVTVLFSAMLLDRKGVTLRTLALAALIILLLFPEAMFGASFQLSFAATIAIVSIYEGAGRRLSHGGAGVRGKLLGHAIGIAVTSLVATLATLPFMLYNFNRFAMFGLLSNMIVIPLATFVIMPGMVLALLLMPFGLQAIGYAPLAFGTDLMIRLAEFVTSLPYAALHLPSPSDSGLIAAALGLGWLCIMQQRWRFLGIPVILLGIASMSFHIAPDILISDDLRQVMVRLPDGRYTMLKGTGRSFTTQSWLRAEGEESPVPLRDTPIDCSDTLCRYKRDGFRMILLKNSRDNDTLDAACAQKPDLLVAWRYLHTERCPGPARLIGRVELEQFGAWSIALSPGHASYQHAKDGGDNRPWHVKPLPGYDDEDDDE